MQYPNLVALTRYHSYHPDTFARFAGVTPELFTAILNGKEEMQRYEAVKIARYSNLRGLYPAILLLPFLVMMEPTRPKHRRMMEQLSLEYERIRQQADLYSKTDHARYMEYDERKMKILQANFEAGKASYMEYLGMVEEINSADISAGAERERRSVRGLKEPLKEGSPLPLEERKPLQPIKYFIATGYERRAAEITMYSSGVCAVHLFTDTLEHAQQELERATPAAEEKQRAYQEQGIYDKGVVA